MSARFLHHGYLKLPITKGADLQRLDSYFTVYPGASPVDRTGTVIFPTQMQSIFPLPPMRPLRQSYEELCHQRAIDLLALAAKLDSKIHVFWSGGVDSTLVLTLLLTHCKDRDRITILLDESSILEYPLFFCQHINGKLEHRSTSLFPDLFVAPNMIVNGEHNDQLFGSDILGDAIALFGIDAVVGPLRRELITSLFEYRLCGKRDDAMFLSGVLGALKETAPIPLRTNFDLLWWINFALKWQNVHMRSLIFSRKPLSREYVKTYYHPFFCTAEFQLWSMNNLDKRIKVDKRMINHWRSYKWPAKDLIYEFTADSDYRDNKTKYGSLQWVLRKLPFHNFLDENYGFRRQMDWYRPQNSFHVTKHMRSLESISA